MADLPYRYDDDAEGTLFVTSDSIEMHKGNRVSAMAPPTGDDAAALAETVLVVGELPDHHVVTDATMRAAEREVAEDAARSMRSRIAGWLVDNDFPWEAEQIRGLPLLVDADADADAEGAEPCRSFTVMEAIEVYCEHSSGAGHGGLHYAVVAGCTRTWTDDAPAAADYRVPLIAELLGEDREDAARLLADDPAGTWERVYAVVCMDRARLDEYRRGESPVLDRVAQLERDQGHAEKRLSALEELTRDQADLLEKHSRDLEPAVREQAPPEVEPLTALDLLRMATRERPGRFTETTDT